jgi:hypothetical protein
MLRSLFTAIAARQAAFRARQMARKAVYGLIGFFALVIALVFAALAAFFALEDPLGSAGSAGAVAGGLVVLTLLGLLIVWPRGRPRQAGLADQLGLSALGISDKKDIEALIGEARKAIREVGPVEIVVAAFVAGFFLGRR